LVELLVAIALMGLLSVLGYRGLDSILRGRDELVRRDTEFTSLAQTWLWLERDLAQLLPEVPAARSAIRLQITKDEFSNPVLQLNIAIQTSGQTANTPQAFTVIYRLTTGRLERSEQPLSASGAADSNTFPLLEGATSWQIETWLEGSGWQPIGTSGQQGRPDALKVSLRVSDQAFTRIITLRP
jgi:general secretion pathway protein J